MIDFTLYPNLNGNLGEKKVQIPDGVTTFWPDGDALVGNFVYKDGKLSGFVDTKALITNDAKSTTIPYDYFEAEMENVREDSVKFNLGERCKNFTLKLIPKYKGCKTLSDIKAIDVNYIENDIVDGVWSKELEDLENGTQIFWECSSLTFFNCLKLKSLTNAHYMFRDCVNLTSFETDLSSLTYSGFMFCRCVNLTSFKSKLISLENGTRMFENCHNLKTFESNLSSLTNGHGMFSGCGALPYFEGDLSSLSNGLYMFLNCSSLTSFKSSLKSLSNGYQMFHYCKLDTQSLKNIADTINNVTSLENENQNGGIWKMIHIGIGSKTPSEEEHTYLTQIHNKGWEVYVNGSPNDYVPTDGISLIPIDGEQNLNPIPFWAKPVPSDEESANYIDENGNFFNILGGQFIYVNDPESYGMFINEEDAAANMRLTKIEKDI